MRPSRATPGGRIFDFDNAGGESTVFFNAEDGDVAVAATDAGTSAGCSMVKAESPTLTAPVRDAGPAGPLGAQRQAERRSKQCSDVTEFLHNTPILSSVTARGTSLQAGSRAQRKGITPTAVGDVRQENGIHVVTATDRDDRHGFRAGPHPVECRVEDVPHVGLDLGQG